MYLLAIQLHKNLLLRRVLSLPVIIFNSNQDSTTKTAVISITAEDFIALKVQFG